MIEAAVTIAVIAAYLFVGGLIAGCLMYSQGKDIDANGPDAMFIALLWPMIGALYLVVWPSKFGYWIVKSIASRLNNDR